jgi:hypothetical protein
MCEVLGGYEWGYVAARWVWSNAAAKSRVRGWKLCHAACLQAVSRASFASTAPTLAKIGQAGWRGWSPRAAGLLASVVSWRMVVNTMSESRLFRLRAWSKSKSSNALRAGNRAALIRPSPPWASRAATSRCRQAARNSSWDHPSDRLARPAVRLPPAATRFQRLGQVGQLAGQVSSRGGCGGHHAAPPSTPRAVS